MERGVACTVEGVILGGVRFRRVRLGRETPDWWVALEPATTCHDCNVVRDQFHHLGCDMEQCPKCSGQLLSCGCGDK
jgi:hypothetical protein